MPEVYGLIDPRTDLVRYIGSTKGPIMRRLSQHVSNARCTSVATPVMEWLRELDSLGLTPDIESMSANYAGPITDIWELERAIIKWAAASSPYLLNIQTRRPMPLLQRQRIRMRLVGQKKPSKTAEWRSAHSAKMAGRKHTEETKAKMRAAWVKRRRH